jgi:hypothetical protein
MLTDRKPGNIYLILLYEITIQMLSFAPTADEYCSG